MYTSVGLGNSELGIDHDDLIQEGSIGLLREKVCSLAEYSGCRKLVIKDGLLVGVTILAYDGSPRPCLPGQGVCTYFSCDDDGPGSTSRSDCARLDCV